MAFSTLNGSSRVLGLQHMSESVYCGLCSKLGTSQRVAILREIQDFYDLIFKRLSSREETRMLSGSTREGIQIEGSDHDYMFWPNDHRVIWDMSQSEFYHSNDQTLILADSFECPPGFSLLKLLTPTDSLAEFACVRINDSLYVSSSEYKKLNLLAYNMLNLRKFSLHGPCGTGVVGIVEYDTAWCFVSDFWPHSALSWKDRCRLWPDSKVVNDIVKKGCHFVAIGHPIGLHENEEWRISFSQAEYKLVYAMNHCQFLTYGLLKLFLKEVINLQSEETVNLLCSYHMKTVVFWAIQQNTMPHLCPQNLLTGFWVCLKFLLKWVREGICPNFFIPQNNMFLAKVHGSKQYSLFRQLYGYYSKGLACLLQSPSISSYIIPVLCNPRLYICTDEDIMVPEVVNDAYFFHDMHRFIAFESDSFSIQRSIVGIKTIEQLVDSPLTPCQKVMLQKFTATVLEHIAFRLHNKCFNPRVNKQMYIADKLSCSMLKIAVRFGCISDMLFNAMYQYKTLRHMEALSIIEMTKMRLAQPYMMYRKMLGVRSYIQALCGQSLSTKMKRAVALDIALDNFVCYINELIPEQQSSLQNKDNSLNIPVFVMLHFLEFLCYRHIDATLAKEALDKLHALVHNDRGYYIIDICRDISWEILGICQQITGDFESALYSFQQSLSQFEFNNVRIAAQRRIHDIIGTNTSVCM
ncbi:uncharacterized protein LOC128164275 [Crassostrea angulata]|uniref:uncharacterized protein LOC128164275 n=1 Tax=Magallana angulata TaxID=2784310 RepID=UPI0022B2072D|nr:uncharacterized protein LOC128164275 [Crassostrea angulata]